MKRDRIVAGIVTFNPVMERLAENLDGIQDQMEHILIYDNGSTNISSVRELVQAFPSARLIEGGRNRGIAYALNRLASTALLEGKEWMLTLDQDSVAGDRMVESLMRYANGLTRMVTPAIVDRNKRRPSKRDSHAEVEVEYFKQAARRGPLTSGSLMSLSAWRAVGGFDEGLFIDYVDYDFNQRLLLAGYSIARVNKTQLLHEVGRAEETWLTLPRRTVSGRWELEHVYSFGHPPMRCYYKARNRIIFTRKYFRFIGITHEGAFQIPAQIILTLLFEGERAAKFKAFVTGIVDGVRVPKDDLRVQAHWTNYLDPEACLDD